MPTAIAFDREGQMYVSSRYDGAVYRVAPNGTMSAYAEGMGVATGMAFDREQNLYVGDRSGTIFKISRDRQIFVFATLEPSVSAYHLAFSPNGQSVRHRADDFQLRRGARGRSARQRVGVLPRAGTAAGPGLRRGRKSVRGGVAARQTRHRAGHARRSRLRWWSPDRTWSGWPLRRDAPRCSPPPAPSIISPGTSRAIPLMPVEETA